MEFISETEGTEYSSKPTYPPGKWFFYEKILEVLNYAIFEPDAGVLEVYRLDRQGNYQLQTPDANNRYSIPEMNLYKIQRFAYLATMIVYKYCMMRKQL